MNKRTNERTSRKQYAPHFFKVGGITMKKQRRGLDRYNVLHDGWRSLVCQTTPLKSEAKEDNQLNPRGPRISSAKSSKNTSTRLGKSCMHLILLFCMLSARSLIKIENIMGLKRHSCFSHSGPLK